MKSKKDILIRFSGYISVAIIAIAFVFVGLITISKTGRSVRDIVIESALSFMVGMLIGSILDMQGIGNGKNDERYLETKATYGEMVEGISPYINQLDPWCEQKNAENLQRQRTKILMNEELIYEDYFDEQGKAKGYTPIYTGRDRDSRKRERARRKAYRRALRLKLTPLSASALTSEGTNPDDPYYLGKNEKEHFRDVLMSDASKKALTALIFGYYCVDQIINFSYATLLWRVFQISIHLVSGVFKMLKAQSFIVNDQRMQMVRKMNLISAFKNDMEGKVNGTGEIQRHEPRRVEEG